MRVNKPSVGDVFEIPLPDNRFAYCQFIYYEGRKPDGHGYLIRVFDRVTEHPIKHVNELTDAGELFPPVFVGLLASLKSGRWRKIGTFDVQYFHFPLFRDTNGTKPGVYHDWVIYDGERTVTIGDLPSELRSLEVKCIWGYELLEERIMTGENLFDKVW